LEMPPASSVSSPGTPVGNFSRLTLFDIVNS
jgi:hypothetical protein